MPKTLKFTLDISDNDPKQFDYNKRRRSSAHTKAIKSQKLRKIVVLGSTKSGKTSLIKQFLDNTFDETYTPTVEESYNRDYKYLGYNLNLNIVDTCCPFMFPVMRDLCVKEADVVMIVYEINNKESIAGCLETHKIINELRPYLPVTLVGTKLDLHLSTEVIAHTSSVYPNVAEYEAVNKEFQELGKLNLKHVLTSAKFNLRVKDAFHTCLDDVVTRIKATSVSARREPKTDEKKRLCCTVL